MDFSNTNVLKETIGEMDIVKHQLLGYSQSKCNHVYLEIILLYFGSTKYFSVSMAKTKVLGQSISELIRVKPMERKT